MEILSTGEKIKRARVYQGITLKELCSDEISISKMSCIENGKIKADSEILHYISKKLDIDIYTLEDIINSLKKPNRDPRDDFDKPILKSDVLHIEDLKKGMELEGTVRNVVDFGAFIDIGIKNDGLVHISKITDRYIKHPSEVLSVGDIVTCYVDEVFLDKGKVALSLIKNE